MFGGAFISGAADRLLPPSIPYRFFATAIVLHMFGWLALALGGGDSLLHFQGGMGATLAGLHLFTLGVLVMTVAGAAFQLLPVATRQSLGPPWVCVLTWALLAPGVVILAAGMAWGSTWALMGGGSLVLSGLGLFAALVGRTLLNVSDLPSVTRHVWIALGALGLVVVLGMLLVVDTFQGFLPQRQTLAVAHMILGGYGVMGNLILGFSYILVPLFVLAAPVPDNKAKYVALLTGSGLVAAVAGVLFDGPLLILAGGAAGVAGLILHLLVMRAVLAGRMRKKLEPFFRMIFLAWGIAPLGILVGMGVVLGNLWGRGSTGEGAPASLSFGLFFLPLWGWLLLVGWLLSFVMAVLQRIMPFLASMHSGARGGKPVLLSRLIAPLPLTLHAICHGGALLLVAVGMLAQEALAVSLGCWIGGAGSIAFAAFAIELTRRYRAHERAQTPPP